MYENRRARPRRTGAAYGHGGEAEQVRERDHGGDGDHGDEKEPRRGRPRSEAVERAILEAAVALLEEGVPLGGLSIERIARTAGVGKATIYRRWPGKEALFLDLLREFEPQDPELPGTSALDDLRVLLESMRLRGLAQRSSVILHNVVVQMKSHPKLWEEYHRTVVAPRREATLAAVRRGIADGELRADLDPELIHDLIVGPMLMRTLHRPAAPLPDDLADRIIGSVLRGVAPHPAPASPAPSPEPSPRPSPDPSPERETPGP
ncbi:TetR/AcrR family transcriptional regulator [Streptomyces sp. NPDC059096]|uniref:TetR/AcrR family transcriptional regulator n=1 Tax=Streptomyces sp. NPDC059096 TaxID=3346727 RepID=UPI00367B0BD7